MAGLCLNPSSTGRSVSQARVSARASRTSRLDVQAAIRVRPYTVRRGDTLSSIARKRELNFEELVKLNHDVKPDMLEEGQTIILPAGKLSVRDREILAGIGPGTYRTYPVRSGETIEDIISKRSVRRDEVDKLNKDINLDSLAENQLIKLPANRYTVREREMLSGTAGVPAEFFSGSSGLSRILLAAVILGGAFSFWMFRKKNDDDDFSTVA